MRWALATLAIALAVPLRSWLISHMARHQPAIATYDIIVIGGGLAGVTAARAAVDNASTIRVALLDKQPQLGGNSAKASTGINAVYEDGGDTIEDFVADTIASGKQRCDVQLVRRLVVCAGCSMCPCILVYLGG